MDTVDTMRFNTKHELWITMDYLYLTLKHAMRKTQLLPEASLAPQKFAMSLLVSQHKEAPPCHTSLSDGGWDMQFHGSKTLRASESPAEFGGKPFPPAERTCQAGRPVRSSMLQESGSGTTYSAKSI